MEQFACVHEALLADEQEPKKQLGASIRELQAFLREADPNRYWGGLVRHCESNGELLWVNPDAVPSR